MKIVNRETFLALPVGTVFAKYDPCMLGEVMIKGENLSLDFYTQDFTTLDVVDPITGILSMDEDGEDVAVDMKCESRDGCFDLEQRFAVWNPEDHRLLILALRDAFQAVNGWRV